MELHALMIDQRIVATLGALCGRDRLSGLVVSYGTEREIARCSPGELIVHEVVRSAIARGFTTFDLGVGEARYKAECCEATEALFDTSPQARSAVLPVSPTPRAAREGGRQAFAPAFGLGDAPHELAALQAASAITVCGVLARKARISG